METRFNLTREQRRAKLHILRGKDVFLTGGAGTGKSFLLIYIAEMLVKNGKSVVLCAPTGAAALKIGGVTIHSLFGFPAEVCINDGGTKRGLTIRTRTTDAVRNADILIIDEISMARVDLFDAVMASVEKIEKKTGKRIQVILSGDFYQLPPALKHGSNDEDLILRYYKKHCLYAFQGVYWNKRGFVPFLLTEIVRQADCEFAVNLNLLREGNSKCIPYFNQQVKSNPIADAPYLYAYNKDVDKRNLEALNTLPGSVWRCETEVSFLAPNIVLDASALDDIPPTLYLKSGAKVMITENDHGKYSEDISALRDGHYSRGPLYVNGTIGHVYDLGTPGDPVIVVTEKGKMISLFPVRHPVYTYVLQAGKPVRKAVAAYTQYPLRLAYATSIHKAQGQTLSAANISPSTFGHGQLYVALSRVKNIEGLALDRKITSNDIKTDKTVSQFYSSLTSGKVTRKMGRPVKNANGSARSCLIWIPEQLKKHIQEEIEKDRPFPLQYSPKYTPERVHIRVPEHLKNHIQEEIRLWKISAKNKRK